MSKYFYKTIYSYFFYRSKGRCTHEKALKRAMWFSLKCNNTANVLAAAIWLQEVANG